MRQPQCIQYLFDIRLASSCRPLINRHQVSVTKVFENRREIRAALAMVEADLEDIPRIVTDDQVAYEGRLRVIRETDLVRELRSGNFQAVHLDETKAP